MWIANIKRKEIRTMIDLIMTTTENSKDLGGMYIAIVLIWYFFYKCKDWKPYQEVNNKEEK